MSSNKLKQKHSSGALGNLNKIKKKEATTPKQSEKISSSNIKLKRGSGDNIGNDIEESLLSFGE